MGHCLSKENRDADDSYSHVDFAGGNVQLITTKESWEQKLSEASRDGQIDLSTSWDIKATPTFFFLRDGQQLDKLVGANKPELQKKITAIVDSVVQSDK
uniref:Thioredoxin H-type-like n=1 Tax=Rhizophora mucronata TaxID=61149 RepID=A0A2P2LZN5_RHIMU